MRVGGGESNKHHCRKHLGPTAERAQVPADVTNAVSLCIHSLLFFSVPQNNEGVAPNGAEVLPSLR